MAARFVVGLALVALCHSSPVLINGVENRDGRSLSAANGFASGYGGENKATANVHGNSAQSTGFSNGAGLARDGLVYSGQGQALANAQTYDGAAPAVDLARLQGYYQPIAQPLPVVQPAYIAYNQIPQQQFYSAAPATAESSAITNEAADSSLSTVNTHGAGKAESTSHTAGIHGLTNTNAKTFGGFNSAASNANTASGIASVSSKAGGSGVGNGYASSNAETQGLGQIAPNAPIAAIPSELIVEQPAVIAVKNNGFYNPTLYNAVPLNSAASTANVNGFGTAQSAAKTAPAPAPARKSISWRFGTAYDIPAGYGSNKAAAPFVYQAPTPVVYETPVVYQAAPIAYETALPLANGNAKSNAYTQGSGNAASSANLNAGFSSTRSTANSNLGGNANSNADINNAYGIYRSAGLGSGLKSSVNTIGQANADSTANWNYGNGIAKSVANSQGGSSAANADLSNRGFGLYRSGEGAQWSRTVSDAKSTGFGNAESTAQGLYGQKIAASKASNNGWGSSFANSQSL